MTGAAAIQTRLESGEQREVLPLGVASFAPTSHHHVTRRNFIDDFRTGNPDGLSWTALPEFFRNHGFFTTGDTLRAAPRVILVAGTDSKLRVDIVRARWNLFYCRRWESLSPVRISLRS